MHPHNSCKISAYFSSFNLSDLNCSYHCGISGKFPYAKCFICGETGHLSKQCPDNPKGLYPMGKKLKSFTYI